VSSTRIRRLVGEGRVDEAGALLGHHYAIDGTVVEGAKRGRELGFPTANLSTANELIPPHGVYATATTIDGRVYPSVTNIGQRPTMGEQLATTIETHILDQTMDLYGKQRLALSSARTTQVPGPRGPPGTDFRGCSPRERLFDRLSSDDEPSGFISS
jgi:riboflavin kinase/FMN adenylyltransferase